MAKLGVADEKGTEPVDGRLYDIETSTHSHTLLNGLQLSFISFSIDEIHCCDTIRWISVINAIAQS